MSSIKISVRLDTELAARIAKAARELCITDSEATRAAIVRGLDAQRDSDAIAEIRTTLAKILENQEATAQAVVTLYERLLPETSKP